MGDFIEKYFGLKSIQQNYIVNLMRLGVHIKRFFRAPWKRYRESRVEYSLPFKEEWFVNAGGTTMKNSHSWWINAQRYAYDFIIIDSEGKSYKGDHMSIEGRHCYGKEILAPANGTVVEVCDKYDNTEILQSHRVNEDYEDLRGNFVIIKHNSREYSSLLHLLKGSVCVEVGQEVQCGEVIGRCGNSGRTSGPHLHFQIQDGKSFFASAGIIPRFKGIGYIEKGMKVKNI